MSILIDWEVRECRPENAGESWVGQLWHCTARTQVEAREQAAAGLGLHKDLLIARPQLSVVSVHLVDRGYGGPEEGGWWFDYGHPICDWDWVYLVTDHKIDAAFLGPFVFGARRDAYETAARINARLDDTINKGRAPIHSTQSSGEYRAIVQSGQTPHPWPAETPRYE